MTSIVRKLIEYEGIADHLPEFTHPVEAFKQFNIQEVFEVPSVKPNMEQIVKVKANLVITSTKVIKTPVAESMEGQFLTGWKLVVEGEVRQAVQYVAEEQTQGVHAAHKTIPFSTFVVLPPDYSEENTVDVQAYIEDIYAEMLNCRRIFKNITILLIAKVM